MFVSINILPEFSLDVDVTRSMPAIPSRLSSIFKTTPSSISLGEPPGSAKFIEIYFGLINGKKDDFKARVPAIPNTIKKIIKILTGIL